MKLSVKKKIDYYLGGFLILLLKPLAYLTGVLLKRDHSLTPQGDVVFIKMLGGGSILLALPSLIALRRKLANRFILVTTRSVEPFAKMVGIFDEILIIDDSRLSRLFLTFPLVYRKIFRCDTVIDLEVYSRLTSIVSVLTMARNRITFYLESVFWRKNLHTHLIYLNQFNNIAIFYNKIAELLEASVPTYIDTQNYFKKVVIRKQIQAPDVHTVAIGSTCSENGAERMLTGSQWENFFRSQGLPSESRFVFLGSQNERVQIQKIIDHLKNKFGTYQFENFAGQTSVLGSAEIIYQCHEFWGIDSSLLHIARLFNKKCTSFWGPTAPHTRLWQPLVNERIFYAPTSCSPCIHVAETPPCHGNNICIQRLFHQNADQYVPVIFPLAELRND